MPTLNWIGKEAVINHHQEVPFRLLKDVPDLASGDPGTGNLIVEGDNLIALKALLPYYRGKVKCVCIDPPYNTGNEGWAYNDNVNSPAIKKWLGETVGKEGETLDRHDRWLCMMYPRLALLRELLSEEGSIWITLDDNEIHALRYVMDEVFGAQNFIGTFVWQKRASPDNDETFATAIHDNICCYSRHKTSCKFNRLPRTEEADARYENPDNDPRGPWTSSDLTRREYREHDFYPVKLPSGREVLPAAGRSWSVPKDAFEALVRENRIWFGPKGDSMPRRKRFLTDVSIGMVPTSWWVKDLFGDNQSAKREVRILFPDEQDIFATPKPTRLIERILQIATNPGDIVLDSFAGSGTTGHAVLKMNVEATSSRLLELGQEATSSRLLELGQEATSSRLLELGQEATSSRLLELGQETTSSRLTEDPKRQDAASTSTFFDPREPTGHLLGNLPHWRQNGVTYFVTFRTADSMPQEKLAQWSAERAEWLETHPEPHDAATRAEYYERFPRRLEHWLDEGHGACHLARPEIRDIVETALRHFDGDRYRLGEFVVMPNHIHALVTPLGEHTLSKIVQSWKSFTANKINAAIGGKGHFWQKEYFDHIVRNPEQMERIRQYIRDNPKFVKTSSGGFVVEASSRRFGVEASSRRLDVEASSRRFGVEASSRRLDVEASSRRFASIEKRLEVASTRRFILVEMEPRIARDITRERVCRVAEGYKNAKGENVPGLGGGFRYVTLGDELFDERGRIRGSVRFADFARHVYFSETGEPLPKERISAKSPLLGVHHGRAVYLLYNGILKDKSVDGGNILTAATLALLPAHNGPKVVYAAGCRFSKARLEREGITFKQTPYAIRTK